MYSHTVLTAADVRRIARHAQAAELNRQITAQAVWELDPNRFSIMAIAVPFHNIDHAGPVHHRVNAFLAVRGQEDPAEVEMDVLAADWDRLPEAVAGEVIE